MAKKYESLDIVKMYSTLTQDKWRTLLQMCIREGRVEKLTQWRYGMQVGWAAASKGGLLSDKIDHWTIKRIRDLEKAMKIIMRLKYPNPLDNPKADPLGYIAKVKAVKQKRDREFEDFLRKSSY